MEINPHNPKGHYRKARALVELKQHKAAVRSLEVAREFSPRDKQIQKMIADITGEEKADAGVELRCISASGVSQEFDLNNSGKAPVILHTVRTHPGRPSALSVLHRKSILYGAFVRARTTLDSPKCRFPARAVRAW